MGKASPSILGIALKAEEYDFFGLMNDCNYHTTYQCKYIFGGFERATKSAYYSALSIGVCTLKYTTANNVE